MAYKTLSPGTRFGRWTILSKAVTGRWTCQCECGTKKNVRTHNLIAGTSRSCGCLRGAPIKYVPGLKLRHWTILERLGKVKTRQFLKCRCDCGTERVVSETNLSNGRSKSCGCLTRKYYFIRGKKIGNFTMLAEIPRTAFKEKQFLVQCECGNKITRTPATLVKISSCGCKTPDLIRKNSKYLSKFALGNSRNRSKNVGAYTIWMHLVYRSFKKNNATYNNYGKKGIRICDRWRDFDNFIADMGPRPKNSITVGRRNIKEGYSPENCYWMSKAEYNRNCVNALITEFEGSEYTMKELMRKARLKYSTLYQRLHKPNWTVSEALLLKKQKFTKRDKAYWGGLT